MTDYLKRIDYGRVIDRMMKLTTESNTIIRLAIDSFPHNLRSDWSTGIYALSYHEPDIIPEPLRRKNSLTDDVRITEICHGPGTPDDMLTVAYLEAVEYLRYTLDIISRFSNNGKLPFRVIKCKCRSQRWMDQFSNLGNSVNVDPIPESALPMSLIVRIMTELIARFDIVFTFDLLDRADFEHERKRYDGKDK